MSLPLPSVVPQLNSLYTGVTCATLAGFLFVFYAFSEYAQYRRRHVQGDKVIRASEEERFRRGAPILTQPFSSLSSLLVVNIPTNEYVTIINHSIKFAVPWVYSFNCGVAL